ncbi:MAG: carboxylate-amine ligase, partial [Acidobacteriota bacterium]|nr:carboxylate-amine ligase [Acidobacteriota bacterium]
MSFVAPGSTEELDRFAALQAKLAPMFEQIFPDPLHPRSVVVIPSLSLSQEILQKITGVQHYEERMLCMLMLLRLPRT